MVIGVTGHRELEDGDRVRNRVEEVLRAAAGESPDGLTLISGLAAGVDQLAADVAIEIGIELEAMLPFHRTEYIDDFRGSPAEAHFLRLLGEADRVREPEPGKAAGQDRTSGYLALGENLVEVVDLLVAVWDGAPPKGPGGTADVVRLARGAGIPVVWVHADPPHAIRLLAGAEDPTAGPAVLEAIGGLRART